MELLLIKYQKTVFKKVMQGLPSRVQESCLHGYDKDQVFLDIAVTNFLNVTCLYEFSVCSCYLSITWKIMFRSSIICRRKNINRLGSLRSHENRLRNRGI